MKYYDSIENFHRVINMSETELWNLREQQWMKLQHLKKELHDITIRYTIEITELECDLQSTNLLLKGSKSEMD